jgi:formylmethanofuran dehydrogenase subunit A
MSTEYTKISGGTLHDPANGIDGQVRDLWIADGKIVDPPADPKERPTKRSTPPAWW